MGKHKVRKSAAKRFKVTGNGKIMHRSPFRRHLRSKKSKKALRRLKLMKSLEGVFKSKLKKMLGV